MFQGEERGKAKAKAEGQGQEMIEIQCSVLPASILSVVKWSLEIMGSSPRCMACTLAFGGDYLTFPEPFSDAKETRYLVIPAPSCLLLSHLLRF